jgi:hypothetical protein
MKNALIATVLGMCMIGLFSLTACSPSATGDHASIVGSFFDALNAKNVDAAATLFTDDGLIDGFSLETGQYRGKDQLRKGVEYLVTTTPPYQILDMQSDTDKVTGHFSAGCAHAGCSDLKFIFVFQGSKIKSFAAQ